MQRKNYIVLGENTMRNAFSMLTAIFVIVIMATVSMLVMSLSGKGIKATTIQYQRAQAMLYAKSYTEFAIMAVTAHDRSTNCVQTINGTIGDINQGGYYAHTNIAYIGPTGEIGNCDAINTLSTNVTTPSTPLTLIIDAYVDYRDPDSVAAVPNLTVHRRTVQKI